MNPFLSKKISRRNLLAGAGASLLGVGLYQQSAAAQEMMESELPTAMQRFSVGDIEITLMQENIFNLPVAAFGGGAEEGEVEALLASKNMPTDGIAASVTVLLLKTATDLILVDTGTGQSTVAGLGALGIKPEDVTRIIISHWHGDHVGGISNEGTLNFPNAVVHFPQADWDFLQAADADGPKGSLAKLQPAEDAGQLELYTTGDLLPGFEAIAAPGHTPGHHALLITSGDDSIMYTADTANNHVTALTRPEWGFGFDADAAKATETRIAILSRLADEGTAMVAYHFPFPGTGYISRDGDGFLFTPGT